MSSKIPIFCDNNVVINLSKSPILCSMAKHIEIKHHFLRDHVQKGHVELKFVSINHQLVDIFTKSLVEERFHHLRDFLGMTFVKE